MGDSSGSEERIAIVTVHGTGDTAATADGEKWFQNGSKFVTGLQAQLAARGVNADVRPHLWSGANSASEREKGARSLAKLVRQLAKTYRGVHVIGHSHGGNVANDAACMLNWSSKKKNAKLASITTVGTPFFRTQVTRSEGLGAWAFGIMAITSTLVLLPALLVSGVFTAGGIEPYFDPALSEAARQAEAAQQRALYLFLLFASVAGIAALIFIFPLAFRGLARIRRAGRKPKKDTSIFAIRHAEDEAISFLRRVEGMPIEPFPRWSVLRGSRTGGIVWGIRVVLALPLIGIFLMATDAVLFMTKGGGYERGYVLPPIFGLPLQDMGLAGAGLLLVGAGLAAAPVIFGVVYLLYRLVAGTAGEFAFRHRLNGVVSGALRGLAFGRDGDNRIGDVSPNSHYYASLVYVLGGDVATRMSTASNDASRRLFEKYRKGVFSSENDQNEVLNEIAKDALTWDALVHTTYFDQPEVLELCSSYIGAVARGEAPATAEALRSAALQECPKPARRKIFLPLLRTVATVAIAGLAVGSALVFSAPILNRDSLAREDAQVFSHGQYTAGQIIQDCSDCPEIVVIPGGSFTMGTPTTLETHNIDEGPMRRMTIAPFMAGRYEITLAQWQTCVAEGGCPQLVAASPEDPTSAAVNMPWEAAHQYVAWLSQKTGHSYRLLSEAEWEYAARAGTTTQYSWGDDDPSCVAGARNGATFHDYAGFGCAEGASFEVGRYQANPFGLYDMHGNAGEWVEDCYTATYFGHDRHDGSAFVQPGCYSRVVRGGGLVSLATAWDARSADRGWWSEASPFIGFRVARDL